MTKLRSISVSVACAALLVSAILSSPAAVKAETAARITSRIDEAQLVTLSGNTHPAATAANDRGAVSPDFALPDLTLILSRSPQMQAAFDSFVKSQYDQGSPNFHNWLSPDQIGAQFGPAPADIATISAWLASHGFTVNRVSPDRMTIHFGGNAAQVASAFHTSIHNLSVNGVSHYSNMTDPQIPAALAPVVFGVKSLNSFRPQPQHKLGSKVQFNAQAGKWQRVADSTGPQLTSIKASLFSPAAASSSASGATAAATSTLGAQPLFGTNLDSGSSLEEDVSPYDFATIYNVLPLWNNSINGSGQTIAIAGTSFINLGANSNANKNSSANDVAAFRSAFGLPAGLAPIEIDAGTYFNTGTSAIICTSTSAACNTGGLTENSLDVEWSGAVAPGAQIDLVVTGQNTNGTIDSTYDSSAYIVDNLTAKILSLSYGECERANGTAENVAYYDLWQQAAAEGISVFVATGDSGAPACDDALDSEYGTPYVAQYGLSVNGLGSTPWNTAVGGTDFSWCQPYFTGATNSSGNLVEGGCAASSTSQGSPAYWNTSNNGTTGASAAGYVPEIPWNDSCENPINARFLNTLYSASGFNAYFGVSSSTPEESCNMLYRTIQGYPGWYQLYQGIGADLSSFVDSVGGSGGASGCVANSTNPLGTTLGACTTGATSTGTTTNNDTGASQASIQLYNDGWPKPSWQTGVSGIPADGVRDIPDVSFFAGNGAFSSATLVCVSTGAPNNACTYLSSTSSSTQDSEVVAQELGGTSVATPQMAGVMALINQKTGGAQGLANPQLYQLAAKQTYSSCSAESVTNSSSCYFQDIDYGPTALSGGSYSNAQNNAMPCNLTGTYEGGDAGGPYTGAASPNCAAINSGDVLGTLVSSGTTPAYNSAIGFDLATGLGSLNVANIVNHWVSDAGTGATTMTVTPVPSTITINQAMTVTVSVVGVGTPTNTITLTGDGYSATETIGTSPCTSNLVCVFTIPANTLAPGSNLTLTAYYNGDPNFAANSKTTTITVNVMTPTVTVSAPASGNVANATTVTVSITGPNGSVAIPTGSIYLTSGSYTSATETIGSGACASNTSCVFTIPAYSLVGSNGGTIDTITADYSGDGNFGGHTGSTTIDMTQITLLTPTITVTPVTSSVDSGQTLGVTVSVTGSGSTPTGTVYLTSGSYTSSTETIGVNPCGLNTSCSFTIPANSLAVSGSTSITAAYSGNSFYSNGIGSGTVSVTQSTFALAQNPTPASSSVTPGSSTTVTLTGTNSSTNYTGTVSFSAGACNLTTSSVASPNDPPTCSISGSITYANGTASGSATATISTTASVTTELVKPKLGNGKQWLGAGGGMVLAFLMFLGVPARRKSWRAMFGLLVLTAVLSVFSACGGSSSGGGSTTIPGTTAGTYTFTATGTGSPAISPAPTTTFTVTVN
jgi:subtilase family serine protease